VTNRATSLAVKIRRIGTSATLETPIRAESRLTETPALPNLRWRVRSIEQHLSAMAPAAAGALAEERAGPAQEAALPKEILRSPLYLPSIWRRQERTMPSRDGGVD
jgi:hypothetical protein